MIGERIQRARLALGLSLRALAEQVGLSQTAIQNYEKGDTLPSSDKLLQLAAALQVRVEYFFRPESIELSDVAYRKHTALPEHITARVRADVAEQLERDFALHTVLPASLPDFMLPPQLPEHIETLDQIEAVAEATRRDWRIGEAAVPALIDLLEAHGIIVLTTSVHAGERFDGLSARAAGHPVIVVGDDWPGDRQRFTLAHELGHLLLHARLAADLNEEKACDRFAGAFLVPAAAARNALGEQRRSLDINELMLLKRDFGLSMQGWLMRAVQLGILSSSAAGKLHGLFRKRGWHRQEPGPAYPSERPTRFTRAVYRALAEDLISTSKAAELLGRSIFELHEKITAE